MHIGNNNVVPCDLSGPDSPEKSVHQKTSRMHFAQFIPPSFLLAPPPASPCSPGVMFMTQSRQSPWQLPSP